MTGGLSRRRALLVALATLTPAAARAEDVLRQANSGEGVVWTPIISAFYARPDQTQFAWPEADGPPVFPEGVLSPALHFTLNPSPVDSAPTLDTDWAVFQKRLQNQENASAFVVARQFGKPRLWLHRTYDEEFLAGYPESHQVFIVAALDLARESLPLPGQPSGPARKDLIRQKIRIVDGRMEIVELNGVRQNGAGGTPAATLVTASLAGTAMGDLASRAPMQFVPRSETRASGDLLDGVISVTLGLELEAGTDLGLEAPERKKLSGEIRFAVGKQYIDIGKLSGENKKK